MTRAPGSRPPSSAPAHANTSSHRPRQPGASLAQIAPPRIVEFEPIPAQFKPRRPAPFRMDLSEILPEQTRDATLKAIADSGRMAFQCVGDTGGIKRPESQQLVARGMEAALKSARSSPSFCYHIGDVVYYNGEVQEYWPQFYEPYEHYPLPIVAIPGNHDGEKLAPDSISLEGFYQNFLAERPGTFTHESRDSGRTAMSQPNFYWTLTTPFATFIGLYTNVPEHGKITPEQRQWFQGEMHDADPDKALIVALHHPVYSFDDHHSGSSNMALELQNAINASRRIPNLVLTAHVHNYQRIELKTAGVTIPFFVIGNGGYWNLHHLTQHPGYQDPGTEAVLIAAVDDRHGFMTFEIGAKVINGYFTTVPRPQESWSDVRLYDSSFDVFSYQAAPMHLPAGATAALVPGAGSHLPPHPDIPKPVPPARGAAHGSARREGH
ncbi:MAG TPA: metallophosphoesterase [Acetobacteraceae bacterium]|nr:metallophosphoesterase [Acetobacteraceae bacterium]